MMWCRARGPAPSSHTACVCVGDVYVCVFVCVGGPGGDDLVDLVRTYAPLLRPVLRRAPRVQPLQAGEGRGQLPLEGSIPDMHATTE